MKKQRMSVFAVLALLVIAGQGWAKTLTTLDGVINVNVASAQELQLLPGVGEVKAQAIIDARSAKPFASLDDLLAVKGIGEKMIQKWAPYLAFEGETTLKEIPAPATTAENTNQ
ncbi:MAG: helix-hairpin-helix domain-containing protein [Deltaproteobacteria bacterium]|nr:helix-hairpin-helix domain-containing protein [Deltaproteobacteria bacterium]